MNKLTLNQVQELYYTENADYEDEGLTPFEVLEKKFGPPCEVDETPDYMEVFIKDFLKVASDDIIDWIFDVDNFDATKILLFSTNDDFHRKHLQRYIDEERYEGHGFSNDDIKRLVELMTKFKISVTENLIDNIFISRKEPYSFTGEIEYLIQHDCDISDYDKFMYYVSKYNKYRRHVQYDIQ